MLLSCKGELLRLKRLKVSCCRQVQFCWGLRWPGPGTDAVAGRGNWVMDDGSLNGLSDVIDCV
jgi:hypothetical protein